MKRVTPKVNFVTFTEKKDETYTEFDVYRNMIAQKVDWNSDIAGGTTLIYGKHNVKKPEEDVIQDCTFLERIPKNRKNPEKVYIYINILFDSIN